MKMHTMTSLLALASVAGLSISATAQDTADQVVSVYERSRPDFQAPGARSGSFIFSPTINAGGRFNSNIFARRAGATASNPGEIDDFIWSVQPNFALTSDWNQNFVQFTAGADIAKYSDNGREDYEDFNVGVNGRIDIERGMNFTWGANYVDQHEDRGAPDTNGLQSEQTRFQRFDANVGFLRDQSIMSLAVDANYENWTFSDADLLGGGRLDNTQRERERFSGRVRVGYEVDQYYDAFVELTANRVEYEDAQATGGPQRNSDGWEARVGAAFDLTGTSRGEFFVGYLRQEYDSDSLGEIDDFTFGANLLWNPTGLTSVNVGIIRAVNETIVLDRDANNTLAFASGVLATTYSLGIEHELQRNFLVKAGLSYGTQDFNNTIRSDDNYTANLGAKYFINRNFALNADYNWDYRNTNAAGQDFKRHVFMVGLTANW
ncbi:MAG: outer membrane beta-barrel protein [Kordiimonadaceae bacterium]|nr:outer membrane beta-barrel protein [Kordiimonadaceae bacterium]MBO6568784.1 outer membrane beta-barrel protein [Kordiimonadaceae bacterium]MBO6965241.1 outer membrane beta-barrel protein [Kordiimonadaceae bacterium]